MGNYEIVNNTLEANGPMIALRGLFLIDKNGIIQHQLVNYFTLVRNVNEILRIVDALQYFEKMEFLPCC